MFYATHSDNSNKNCKVGRHRDITFNLRCIVNLIYLRDFAIPKKSFRKKKVRLGIQSCMVIRSYPFSVLSSQFTVSPVITIRHFKTIENASLVLATESVSQILVLAQKFKF